MRLTKNCLPSTIFTVTSTIGGGVSPGLMGCPVSRLMPRGKMSTSGAHCQKPTVP